MDQISQILFVVYHCCRPLFLYLALLLLMTTSITVIKMIIVMIIVVIIKVAPQLLSGDFPSKEKTSNKIKLTSIRKRFT